MMWNTLCVDNLLFRVVKIYDVEGTYYFVYNNSNNNNNNNK